MPIRDGVFDNRQKYGSIFLRLCQEIPGFGRQVFTGWTKGQTVYAGGGERVREYNLHASSNWQ